MTCAEPGHYVGETSREFPGPVLTSGGRLMYMPAKRSSRASPGAAEGTAPESGQSFVGRDAELELLAGCAVATASGAPQLVVVEGEAGIGKTSLVRQALAALTGHRVWWAGCDPSEQDWPYGVVEQWLRQVDPELVKKSVVLRGRLGPSVAPVAVGVELVELLGSVQDLPLVLVVDDVQWADDASLQVLGSLLRWLWQERVLLVATCRTDPAGAEPGDPSQRWRQGTWAGQTQVLRLSGLPEAQAGLMADEPLSAAVLRRLWEHTRGHPLYLRSILASTTPGDLADVGAALPVPTSLASAVRRSLERLPADSRALVEALAVLGIPSPVDTAARIAKLHEQDFEPDRALSPLLEAGLLVRARPDPAGPPGAAVPVGIAHPLQRDAIYQAIRPERRRALHAAAVGVVETDAAWAHRVASTSHLDGPLAESLDAEADRNARLGYLDRAATLLLWAADLSDRRELHERRLLTAAEHTINLINPRGLRAAHPLRGPVEQCAPCAKRTLLLSCYVYMDGDYQGAVRLGEQALAEAEAEGDLATLAQARLRLGLAVFQSGDAPHSALLLRQALQDESAGTVNDTRTYDTIATQLILGNTLLFSQGPTATLREPWIAALPADRALARSSGLIGRGTCLLAMGDLQAARRDVAAVLEPGRSDALPLARLMALIHLSACHYLLGDWELAAAASEQILAEGDIGGFRFHFITAHAYAAIVAGGQGRWRSAQEHLDASQSQVPVPTFSDQSGLAAAAIAQGRADHAAMLSALRPLYRDALGDLVTWPTHQFWPMWTEALTATGQLDQARDALAHLCGLARRTPFLRTAAAFATGQLAEAHGDLHAAADAYHRVLDTPLRPDDPPFHRARLEEAACHLHHLLGDHQTAAVFLDRARARYTALGAQPFLERAV
ncbi:AAA family ATPase [Kitasatospora sp. MBT63]|uniref:ATP-binding protein n=1 Tax=Kitasatospora sp. MBT63 TaxID=1444768 RepID=UPI001314951D|nr:AAA family ATPase [Kitasatospora sp. MBT63]